MTSVIGFMTSILFCRKCDDINKCNGMINCPWLSPHDEANCSQQCSLPRIELIRDYDIPVLWFGPIPCACNKPLGNMTCARGQVCYHKFGKLLVLFYFCKRHND